MTVNTEVKGQLARLLATENLQVEHRKITTAYFDVENRVLALPIWKDVSNDVYDLLVGHEVGHALYTPLTDFSGVPKDFINVLEDARIEKLMKKTYPGLRKSFYKGYSELYDRDFFGTKGNKISKMAFIDRINLYFKIGSYEHINFTDEELVYVKRAANTETFEEVVELAKELVGYLEKKEEDKEDLPPFSMPQPKAGNDDGNEDVEYNPQSSQETITPEKEEKGNPITGDTEKEEEKGDTENPEQGDSSIGGADPAHLDVPSYEVDEMISETDLASIENQQKLVDDSAKEWVYLNTPKVYIDKIITPYKEVLKDLIEAQEYAKRQDSENSEYMKTHYDRQRKYNEKKYAEFQKSSNKTVNYLVKQFEMKKSASQYARASVSRTGVLNTNSLYKYKLTDDIFKKNTIVPDGKNHGLIMYVDWSGSMNERTPSGSVLTDTIKQTYNLVWFCKKVNIPFRVYAFSNGFRNGDVMGCKTFKPEHNVLALNTSFELFELFSSQMKKKELEQQMAHVWALVWNMHSHYGYHTPAKYGLGGTPLGEAVIVTPEIVKRFQSIEKVEKINIIMLSDGESNPLSFTRATSYENYKYRHGDPETDYDTYYRSDYLCHHGNKVFILRDPETRYTRKLDIEPSVTTKTIVDFYKNCTDYNWIGIRIGDKRDLHSICSDLDYGLAAQYDHMWSKQKFAAIKEYGFTELYVFPSNNMGSGTNEITVKSKGDTASAAELTRAFKKHMGSKMTNKVILNKFVEQIA